MSSGRISLKKKAAAVLLQKIRPGNTFRFVQEMMNLPFLWWKAPWNMAMIVAE